jgi:hypothetical protein
VCVQWWALGLSLLNIWVILSSIWLIITNDENEELHIKRTDKEFGSILFSLEYQYQFFRILSIMYMKLTPIGLVMSVCMIQLENCWTDLDEIWYGCYTIGDYPKIVFYNFLQLVILTWQAKKLVRWDQY